MTNLAIIIIVTMTNTAIINGSTVASHGGTGFSGDHGSRCH
jgi:hypothetical protein